MRSTNPHPWFRLGSSVTTITTKASHYIKKNKAFKNTKHLFYLFSIFYYKAQQRAKWAAVQVTTMLLDHKPIDKEQP